MATTKLDFLNNPTWVKCIEEFFNVRDVNKNGYVELNDFRIFAENLKKLTNNERPEALQRALDADLELAAAIGIKEGDKLNKDQWIDALTTTAADFNARSKRGETLPSEKLTNGLFDSVDVNKDGTVTLEDYKLVFKAYNMDETTAAEGFATLDKNKNGKIERKEVVSQHTKYWWFIDDEEGAKGSFGQKFEN